MAFDKRFVDAGGNRLACLPLICWVACISCNTSKSDSSSIVKSQIHFHAGIVVPVSVIGYWSNSYPSWGILHATAFHLYYYWSFHDKLLIFIAPTYRCIMWKGIWTCDYIYVHKEIRSPYTDSIGFFSLFVCIGPILLPRTASIAWSLGAFTILAFSSQAPHSQP